MRIALIGDSHFDSRPGGRFEECVEVHDWIARDLAARNVDLCLHSGDVLERKSTAEERNAIRAWAQRVADVCPLVIVRGNHDPVGDLDIFGHLETRHPIIVEERAAVHQVAGAVIGCLAWPSKASVLAAAGGLGLAEGEQAAGDALRAVLRGLGQQMADAALVTDCGYIPRILLTHAMVRGSRTSVGQPLVGCDLEVGTDDLRLAGADFYALGHIHMPQEWAGELGQEEVDQVAGDIVYPGSPRRTSFGEVEEKGYVLIDADDATRECTWERVPTPCAPMLLLEAEWVDGRFQGDTERDHEVDDAEIRFRYSFPADQRAAAQAAAEDYYQALFADGAAVVKLDPQTLTTSAARAPEVAAARTLADKLRALWKAQDRTPEPARAERLVGYAHDLEHAS